MRDMVRLGDVAHARSGDKGNHANVAVLAYTDAGFTWLLEELTAGVVANFFLPKVRADRAFRPGAGGHAPEAAAEHGPDLAYFGGAETGPATPRVERFVAANVRALNFVLYDILAGGASQSLNLDNQGKVLGLALLELRRPAPANVEALLRPKGTS